MGCEQVSTDLSLDEAFAVLEPFYEAMQRVYVEEAGLERVRRTRLYVAPWIHDTPRHFAACRVDGRAIVVAPEMVELPYETVIAIFSHELGHAADFLYPGEFALRDRDVVRRDPKSTSEVQWQRWVRGWEARDEDAVELTADAIAHYVTGNRIGYLGPCQLQAFDRGRARPQGLR